MKPSGSDVALVPLSTKTFHVGEYLVNSNVSCYHMYLCKFCKFNSNIHLYIPSIDFSVEIEEGIHQNFDEYLH